MKNTNRIHPDWAIMVKQLRARREQLGISRAQIAEQLGYVTRDRPLYDWESMRRQPPNEILHRWVALLGGTLRLDFGEDMPT